MHLGDIVKSTRASGDATAMGGQRRDETPFHRLLITPARSRVLARLASLVQMESLLLGCSLKPMLNTELN